MNYRYRARPVPKSERGTREDVRAHNNRVRTRYYQALRMGISPETAAAWADSDEEQLPAVPQNGVGSVFAGQSGQIQPHTGGEPPAGGEGSQPQSVENTASGYAIHNGGFGRTYVKDANGQAVAGPFTDDDEGTGEEKARAEIERLTAEAGSGAKVE